MDKAFPILALADEIRLEIYWHALPSDERIFLDPENFYDPLPYVKKSYPDALNLLLTCKRIRTEVTQFLFSRNIINVVDLSKKGNFLQDLGNVACQFITNLEVHVKQGIGELGYIWKTMNSCPKLNNLRLVFYHDRQQWIKTLAQLAHYAQRRLDSPTGKDGGFELGLELYKSIWAYGSSKNRYPDIFKRELRNAPRDFEVLQFKIPDPLRRITITASVNDPTIRGFSEYLDSKRLDSDSWCFKWTGHKRGTPEVHHYRWVKEDGTYKDGSMGPKRESMAGRGDR
ncbi:hypothetical protein DL766_003463 [Monosporascus sp. MC13-8B]|uniref:F-box domain-containing protein n=1 Tax=Monosporascus cannonballus TaxID=155416 RepID=A0ABY0H9K1_9PEZI|nr:hypothetical protein DL762_003800 [Monosporascus cannonballus]RYP33432.1 hypothetical protein DL766_003463 [Monosporascus sp. MC13-8B]